MIAPIALTTAPGNEKGGLYKGYDGHRQACDHLYLVSNNLVNRFYLFATLHSHLCHVINLPSTGNDNN